MKTILICAAIVSACFINASANAQAQVQTRVYTTTSAPTDSVGSGPVYINAYSQDAQTGAFSAVPGSPFLQRLGGSAMAVDALGRFLFVANGQENDISMFQIDSITGALSEVAGSPFAAAVVPNAPVPLVAPKSLATEPTGQYLYVGYGPSLTQSAIFTYQIDAAHKQLIPIPQFEVDRSQQTIVSMLTDFRGRNLYVANGTDTFSGVQPYQINPLTGALTSTTLASANWFGRSMAIDPAARFLYFGTGQLMGTLQGWLLSVIDSLPSSGPRTDMGIGRFPGSLAIDSTGTYLYTGTFNGIFVYTINQTSGSLTLQGSQGSPVSTGSYSKFVTDPHGPYLHTLSGTQVHTYHIDSQTGGLTELAGSPFGTAGGVGRDLVVAPPTQPVSPISGPLPQFESTSLGFAAEIGTTSSTALERLVNNGQQTLFISSISIQGVNSAEFASVNNCGAALSAGAFCTISLTFTPTVTGPRQATLVVVDNGPGGAQSVALSGAAVQPLPAITLTPATVTFTTVLTGSISAAQNITVSNSGGAALSISGVALSGPNPGDFRFTNACTAPITAGGSCTIPVVFAPIAAGQRTAQLVLSHNALGSPHTISLTGAATPYTISTSGGGGSPGANVVAVVAGATAQYNLQIVPVAGFSGAVQLQCSGVPQAATCNIPAAVSITNGAVAAFTVSVVTTADSILAPSLRTERPTPMGISLFAAALVFGFLLIVLVHEHRGRNGISKAITQRGMRFAGATACITLLAVLSLGGCGGGSGSTSTPSSTSTAAGSSSPISTNPAVAATPRGTYTVTVTATSGDTSQQFPLTLIVQ
jgi:6-phosphogluconolactonase (cycloisomerase 2 family)